MPAYDSTPLTDEQRDLAAANAALPYWTVLRRRRSGECDADTDDLCQEVALSLLRAARGFDTQRGVRFGTYAGGAAIHEASRARALRARHRSRFRATDEAAPCWDRLTVRPQDDPAAIAAWRDEVRHVLGLVERLPEHLRDVLLLAAARETVQGGDSRDNARTLGISHTSYRARLCAARRELRRLLEREAR